VDHHSLEDLLELEERLAPVDHSLEDLRCLLALPLFESSTRRSVLALALVLELCLAA
jgi:hypothetical protein